MTKHLKIAAVCCLLAGHAVAAEDPPKEVRALSGALLAGKPLTTEQQKRLAVASVHHHGEIVQSLVLVKLGGSEEESARARRALKLLHDGERARARSVFCGATVGWYLFFDQGSITSVPMVVKVEEGSEAARAGLQPGDVIDRCAGVALKSEGSRNKFAQFMYQWPESEPLKIDVRRTGRGRVRDGDLKTIQKTLVFYGGK